MEQSISNCGDKDNGSPKKDKLFDPSIDMLVNDFDDERTLDEEEAIAAGESEDTSAELSNLQKEGNMPLEELLALYGYSSENKENENSLEADSPVAAGSSSPAHSETMEELSEHSPPEEPSKLSVLYEPIPENDQEDASRLLRSVSRVSEEEEEDYEYCPAEDELRKTIMVGSDYQAQIPVGLFHYDDALPYENEDKLLWDPSVMSLQDIEEYLKKAAIITKPPVPYGTQLRDDEQALYLLQQCGHNPDEALRRLRITTPTTAVSETSTHESLWSEEECRNFEAGVRGFGKNFHLIQQSKKCPGNTRKMAPLKNSGHFLWFERDQ